MFDSGGVLVHHHTRSAEPRWEARTRLNEGKPFRLLDHKGWSQAGDTGKLSTEEISHLPGYHHSCLSPAEPWHPLKDNRERRSVAATEDATVE